MSGRAFRELQLPKLQQLKRSSTPGAPSGGSPLSLSSGLGAQFRAILEGFRVLLVQRATGHTGRVVQGCGSRVFMSVSAHGFFLLWLLLGQCSGFGACRTVGVDL